MSYKVTLSLCLIIRLVQGVSIITKVLITQTSDNITIDQATGLKNNIKLSEDVMRNGKQCYSASMDTNFSTKYIDPLKRIISLSGTTIIFAKNKKEFEIKSDFNLIDDKDNECPTLNGTSNLTQTQLIDRLTAPCRYDHLERPVKDDKTRRPVSVYVRVIVHELKSKERGKLDFIIHIQLHIEYKDPRLAYGKFVSSREQSILGESKLRDQIWVPNIFLVNEYDSSLIKKNENNVLTSISSDGSVRISSRIKVSLNCWMNIKKILFNEKKCSLIFKSWMYNTSDLLLFWNQKSPLIFDPKIQLGQYVLYNYVINESFKKTNRNDYCQDLLIGNYSYLNFTVHLTQEVSICMMDYFLPSMMIVGISWISFWLQADQTPARTTLSTSTLLSFITLTLSQDKTSLSKFRYKNVFEIWFLVCTLFIFGSLIEFAFVNTIWRRSKSLELKKLQNKYILKSTLTPNLKRTTVVTYRPYVYKRKFKNMLIVSNTKSIVDKKKETDSSTVMKIQIEKGTIKSEDNSFSTMTPHEASLWIDRKARFVFPLAFILFNSIFWTFVYCF